MNCNPSSVMPNSITGMLTTPAVGYRFHPTNEELIINYLKPKMLGDDLEDLLIIAEVNVCKHEPWDLPGKSKIKSDDSVWYFFCPRDFKYLKSRRSNRRTKDGFWKPTGKNVKIKTRRTKKQIGTKKTLVFYKKATPQDVRTDWIIHEYEYTFDSNQSNQGEYVLCKLKKKSEEKSNKGEPNHHTPSVSDFEAEPSCSMTSDFEYQNRSEMTVNSACNGSEVSHHVACDIDYENSNESMAYSSSQLMTSDFENQYSNELISNSASDGSGSLCSMASSFEYQCSKDLVVNSACHGSGLHHSMAPGCENQYSNDLIVISANDGSGLRHSVASSFENQYSNELMSDSACDGSGSHQSIASDFENPYSIDHIVNSPCENWLMASDLENQESPPQLNSVCGTSVEMSPRFIDQLTYGKGETSYLAVDDFENQNHDKESNISASDEGACNPLMTALLDLENRNPWEKIDMLTFEDFLLSYSKAYFSENIVADSALTEVSPQQLAELEAFFELENSHNSALQPSDMGFGTSASS